jgi:nucleoside-diphosphate-sugar epimerase
VSSEIAIAGGSGFVGTHIRQSLAAQFAFRGLTRSESLAGKKDSAKNTVWHQCDLFSLPQVENALEGMDTAIYLVHSMLPSARLTQSRFEDLDLLIADNFARAAEKHGLKQIIYVGGIIPPDIKLSRHLRSRLEVEEVLASRGTPVTRLRTGLIVGPGGSSLRILVNLTRRLPVMLLPRWVQESAVSISIEDVVRAVERLLQNDDYRGGCFDIGSGEDFCYGDLIETTAEVLKRKRTLINVPFNSPGLSKLWVRIFSSAPATLVNPLVDSLAHGLRVSENPLQTALLPMKPFAESLRESVDADGQMLPNPRQSTLTADLQRIKAQKRVRSVQRLPLPTGWNAEQTAEVYFGWLSRFFRILLRTSGSAREGWSITLRGFRVKLLELEASTLTPGNDRKVYYIRGGLLADPQAEPPGRFEFRRVDLKERPVVITAIHAYQPRLPWFFYNVTQALLHLVVMKAFGRHLKKRGSLEGRPSI